MLQIAVAALLALGAGCAITSRDSAQTSGPMETCHVCRYNNDLACVCVKVKESTPKTEYQGTTYYFCSQDCLASFRKDPRRYLPKSRN